MSSSSSGSVGVVFACVELRVGLVCFADGSGGGLAYVGQG